MKMRFSTYCVFQKDDVSRETVDSTDVSRETWKGSNLFHVKQDRNETNVSRETKT